MIDLMFLKPEELKAQLSKSSGASKRKEKSTAEALYAVFHLAKCTRKI